MTHLILPALLVVTAAPVPKDNKPVYYAATKVGEKREYRSGDGKVSHILLVTKVEEVKTGGLLVTEATVIMSNAPVPYRVLLVTEDAIAVKEGLVSRTAYDPPWVSVRPKVKPGHKWEYDVPLPAGIHRPPHLLGPDYAYTTGSTEKVEVPAGIFNAICVEESARGTPGANRVVRKIWHAPGVGVVKAVTIDGLGKGNVMVLQKLLVN